PGVRGGSLPFAGRPPIGGATMGSTRLRDRVGGRVVPPALALATALGLITFQTAAGQSAVKGSPTQGGTASPIKHLVVIFQENVSFDHYFGTYPKAANTSGEPFFASPRTPSVNGLTAALLTSNPNGANPSRLSHSQALTCDQGHGYTAEQQAYDK